MVQVRSCAYLLTSSRHFWQTHVASGLRTDDAPCAILESSAAPYRHGLSQAIEKLGILQHDAISICREMELMDSQYVPTSPVSGVFNKTRQALTVPMAFFPVSRPLHHLLSQEAEGLHLLLLAVGASERDLFTSTTHAESHAAWSFSWFVHLSQHHSTIYNYSINIDSSTYINQHSPKDLDLRHID